MGLCKCPKKIVTTMFCYEHRVNVCQYCTVANHKSCVVQSYLNWLKDTEFDPTCSLCREDLKNSECVRLLCYHLYHWVCLRKYFDSKPNTTAPAGYKCPVCSAGIFPHPRLVSPVADELKKKLELTNWGRKELSSFTESSIDGSSNHNLVGETARLFNETEMKSTVRKPVFAFAKFPDKNFTLRRSEEIKHSRKIYLPQLYTIDEDCQTRKYIRKRQSLFSWRDIRCRRWRILKITIAAVTVFGLMSVAFIFLLPKTEADLLDYYESYKERRLNYPEDFDG